MANAAKHTPGSWEIILSDDKLSNIIVGQDVSLTDYSNNDASTMIADNVFNDANARLIAAAPELLEALKDIVAASGYADADSSCVEINKSRIDAARAAISKAEGK